MCGASSQQESAFANEAKVSSLLTTGLQQIAGDNQLILGNLTKGLTPIQTAGPSQFGLSPAEEAAERTDVAEQGAQAGAQTANAVRSAISSRGGGTSYLPSGSEASIIGSLAQQTAVQEAEQQSAITQKGYDIGRQNWEFATQELATAPGELENPITNAGSAASGAAGQEMSGANAITAANQAWMGPVGQIIGGVAGGALKGGINIGGGAPPVAGLNNPDAVG
jgi:hypothetical protein